MGADARREFNTSSPRYSRCDFDACHSRNSN
jgi:hypothetical protein